MSLADRGRRDPQPLGQGWELPVVTVGGVLVGAGLAALAGMGAAAALAGGGWVWPAGSQTMIHTLAGVLTGHPGAGLSAAQMARLPGPAWVYTGIALAETVFIAMVIAGGVIVHRHGRPGTRQGMASRAQAAQELGVGQLRAARAIIRPDLYGKHGGGS